MVESLIKDKYIQLLDLIKIEAEMNNSIWDYYNYLNDYRDSFCNISASSNKQNLKDFLRGANRYSDEFIFSTQNYFEIRKSIGELYDILNII